MQATIRVPDAAGVLAEVFAAEEQGLANDRGSYTIKAQDGACVIEISASDATALRALTNSVCKVLIVFEKTNKVIADDE